ncbi:MAG: amidohydrolase family protein [Bacillota bacterium]
MFDVHLHLFPPEITCCIDKYTAKDPFLHQICSSKGHKYATVEDLLQVMERCGVEMAAVSGFAAKDQGLCRLMNDYVLEAARRYPRRLLAMAVVSPEQPGFAQEIRRAAEEGAAGVGELFPWGQGFPLEGKEADRLAGLCREGNLPLLLHVNEIVGHHYTGKGDISIKEAAFFASNHAEQDIIFAHWGGGLLFYELMPELHRQFQRVWYDTAAGPFLYDKKIYRVIREIGVLPRVLLGTDYPLISPLRYRREMEEAGLTPAEIAMICSENARRLFFSTEQHMHAD